MITVTVNYLAILVAAVAMMAVGFVWYSQPVFGKMWMGLIGKSMDDLKKGAAKAYGLSFVAALIECYVLAHFVAYAGATTVVTGVITGLWVWLGFVATILFSEFLFPGRSMKLYILQIAYHLVELVVAGAILAVWR